VERVFQEIAQKGHVDLEAECFFNIQKRRKPVSTALERLEQRRNALYQRLQALGDFRPGTISVNFRKCGKKRCACARPAHPGHGPQYLWNTTHGGQRRAQNLRLGPECGQGHRARFVEFRNKELLTVLAPVEVQRAYYHCEECGAGVIPKDRELDIVHTGFSPGVRRMIDGAGGRKRGF
jgi:hypothetical protein